MASEKSERFFNGLLDTNELIQVGNNFIRVIDMDSLLLSTPVQIRDNVIELHKGVYPEFTPDNTSTIVVFHTERGDYILGSERKNIGIPESFPNQINGSIGMALEAAYAQKSLIEALVHTLEKRMLGNPAFRKHLESNPELAVHLKALNRIEHFVRAIGAADGWSSSVAVHSNPEYGMCVITAVKHFGCSYEEMLGIKMDFDELIPIEQARLTALSLESGQRLDLRPATDFHIYPLIPLVKNAMHTYEMDEITKAETGRKKYGEMAVVTFNDLAMAALGKDGTFRKPVVVGSLDMDSESPTISL